MALVRCHNWFWLNLLELNQINIDKIWDSKASFRKFVTELWLLIDVRCSFPLNILRMNEQDLTKHCGLVHKIFFQSLQFSVTNLSFSFDSDIYLKFHVKKYISIFVNVIFKCFQPINVVQVNKMPIIVMQMEYTSP